MGSQIPDRVQLADPVGHVQAFNARTGKRVWDFLGRSRSRRRIPAPRRGRTNRGEDTATRNVWAPMALDEARGLLYLPTTTPSSDYYGGKRPGANLFAESLVCLDANTGKMKWYFQTVHHGLWDWDIPAPPNLVTITVDGRRIDAVAQVTKRGDHLRLRSRHRQAGLADRRASGADRQRCAGREAVSDAAVSDQAAAVRRLRASSLDDANNLTPEIKALAQEQMQEIPLSARSSRRLRSRARCSGRRRAAARTGAARRSIRRPAICSCARTMASA